MSRKILVNHFQEGVWTIQRIQQLGPASWKYRIYLDTYNY